MSDEWLLERERLRTALADARNYVEAVALNTPDKKKRNNYLGCVSRIDAALGPPPVTRGEHG